MENLNKIKSIIQKLIEADDTYLSRVKGLAVLLKKNLKDLIPAGLYEDLEHIDSITPQKKRVLKDNKQPS